MACRARNSILKTKNAKLKLKNKQLKSQAKAADDKARSSKLSKMNHCRLLRQEKSRATSELSKYKTKVNERLLSIFTETQVKALMNSQRIGKWTNEDIGKAITVRYKNNPYEHLRSIGYPFPATRTLQTWTKKINMEPGICFAVLNLLKNEFENANEMDRQCVIGFDEMAIDSSIDYDPNEDKIYGPKTNVNCWFVRGLFSKWKQFIAYEFDETLSAEKFMNLVTHLENSGLRVRACVNDLGGKNRGLWKKLGIYCHVSEVVGALALDIKSYCINPVSKNKIWFFADAPHLLKLMRNNLIDKGLVLNGGYKIARSDLERLVFLDMCEIRANFPLRKEHLNLTGKQKQKVSYAAHVFSRKTGHAWHVAFPNRTTEGDFILLVANWFDVFNSHFKSETLPPKKPFGLNLEYQLEVLEKMKSEIFDLRVGNSRTIYPFQRGILISIESLKGLFNDVAESRMRMTYIITCRVNQDFVENFFSMLRQIGKTYDHPTAVEVKRRIKLQMLAWGGKLSKTTPVQLEEEEDDEAEPYLTARMINSLIKFSDLESAVAPEPIILNDEVSAANYLDEANFREVFQNMGTMQRFEEFGKEHLCGFVAHKLKEIHPELIASGSEIPLIEAEGWDPKISAGGLTYASFQWRNQAAKLEIRFREFHRNWCFKVNENSGVLKGFVAALTAFYPDIPAKAIHLYIKSRLSIRMAAVNRQLKEQVKDKRRKRSEAIAKAVQRKAPQPLPPQEFDHEEDYADYEDSDVEEDLFEEIVDHDDNQDDVDPDVHDHEFQLHSQPSQTTNATNLSFAEYLETEEYEEI